MQKHAFVILGGIAEAGRIFHALTYATQAHTRGDQAAVYFAGEATRWPSLMIVPDHPLHGLFAPLREKQVVKGACENCAQAFGQTDGLRGVCTLIRGPEASLGQIDVLGLEDAGWRVWLF